jgi:hypothetical protein
MHLEPDTSLTDTAALARLRVRSKDAKCQRLWGCSCVDHAQCPLWLRYEKTRRTQGDALEWKRDPYILGCWAVAQHTIRAPVRRGRRTPEALRRAAEGTCPLAGTLGVCRSRRIGSAPGPDLAVPPGHCLTTRPRTAAEPIGSHGVIECAPRSQRNLTGWLSPLKVLLAMVEDTAI